MQTKGCGRGRVSGRVYIFRSGSTGKKRIKMYYFSKGTRGRIGIVGSAPGSVLGGHPGGNRVRRRVVVHETRVYTRGRQEVVFKWITVPANDSAGEKRACDNLTDGVGDYPAMRNIRMKKTAVAGKVKKRPRACINVINNNSSGSGKRKTCARPPAPPRGRHCLVIYKRILL